MKFLIAVFQTGTPALNSQTTLIKHPTARHAESKRGSQRGCKCRAAAAKREDFRDNTRITRKAKAVKFPTFLPRPY